MRKKYIPFVKPQRWAATGSGWMVCRKASLACDFATVVTAAFRRLYVHVAIEIGTRKILHCNVTAHPTAECTAQQFREAIPSDHSYRFLIHDRDSIFSNEVDQTVESLGLKVLRTPVRAPLANAYCERLIGTMRRECLDFMIPLGERHLRTILREWVGHYNHGRPHRSLGATGSEFEAEGAFRAKSTLPSTRLSHHDEIDPEWTAS